MVCLVSILLNLSDVIAPQGHDWQLMFFPVYILWLCVQWLGVIAMPFYIGVVIAQHKRGI